MAMTIGEAIRKARKAKGLTQAQLADEASINKFVKDRNEMLKKCDVTELRKFINERPATYGEKFIETINNASDVVLEVTLHKMIVNVPKLPKKLRNKSAFWLVTHGYDLKI